MEETLDLNILLHSQKAERDLERIQDKTKKTKQELGGFGDAFKDSFSVALNKLENQLQSFIQGGTFSFNELGQSVLKGFGKMGSDKAINPILGGITSFLFSQGGVMTHQGRASLPIRNYQTGGVATRPQMAIFGEGSSPEAFVPLQNNKIPVQIQMPHSSASQSTPNLQVITQVHLHPNSNNQLQEPSDSSALNQLSERIRSLVVSELLEQSREGGILYQFQKSS